jgi:hypothetical protein
VAEEAVVDFVGVAHVCGAVDGVGELRGAFDAGELVGVCLALGVVYDGVVDSCTSCGKLWRESESEAGHGCEGIFSVGISIRCVFPLRE